MAEVIKNMKMIEVCVDENDTPVGKIEYDVYDNVSNTSRKGEYTIPDSTDWTLQFKGAAGRLYEVWLAAVKAQEGI